MCLRARPPAEVNLHYTDVVVMSHPVKLEYPQYPLSLHTPEINQRPYEPKLLVGDTTHPVNIELLIENVFSISCQCLTLAITCVCPRVSVEVTTGDFS